MSLEKDKSVQAMLDWLVKRHEEVRATENAALQSLEANDVEKYRAKMREKALKLASIYDDAHELLTALPGNLRLPLSERLAGFARSAQTALDLDSVFYMGALLYPDEYKPGEPDNLARAIDNFRADIT